MRALKIESFFDEEELKKIISRRIKVPQEKIENVKFKSSPKFAKSGTSYPSYFREKIYNKRGSSCNFQKTTKHSKEHNERLENEKEPKYLLPQEYRQENEFWSCGESEQDIFNKELDYYKANHKGGRIPKFENSSWEAVINLNETHTMADAQKVAEHIAKKWNFTATRIAIHRDEGHFETDENGEKCVVYNYHAHLNFITLKNARQNIRHEYIKPYEFSELQTEIAEILKMERGEKVLSQERKHDKKHKSGREYAQEQKALELTKKEISAEVEKLRKESKGQGYSQEYFKALSTLKKDLLQEQSIKINELNEILERFKREQDKLKKENQAQAQKIAELEKENEQLKAELAKNRTETALKSPNEPKPSQDINQSEKTQENAPKASQNQKDLETAKELDKKPIWLQDDTRTFYNILQRLEMMREQETLAKKLNEPKISCPSDLTSYAISKLSKLTAQELEKEKLKALNEKAKQQEPSKTIITQKVNFNTSTQNKGRDF